MDLPPATPLPSGGAETANDDGLLKILLKNANDAILSSCNFFLFVSPDLAFGLAFLLSNDVIHNFHGAAANLLWASLVSVMVRSILE